MKCRWESNYANKRKSLKTNPLSIIRGLFSVFHDCPRICPCKLLKVPFFAPFPQNKNPRKCLIYRDFLCFAYLLGGERGIKTTCYNQQVIYSSEKLMRM